MIDLKKKPFYLSDEDIKWVEDTINAMTIEEKIGQLFCPIGMSPDENYLKYEILSKHIGGILFRPGDSKEMQKTHNFLQRSSKVPLLIAANLEAGGDGIASDGTAFAKQMQVAAANDPEYAYKLGRIACGEGAAVGCNWAFAPVVDIDMNFRNPITNVRTYGDDPEKVLANGLEYLRAAKECNVAVSIKHFPGDGVDERDQHLLTSVNSLSCEEWDETFGKVYKGLIEAGALTAMIGHIAMPAYQKKLNSDFSGKVVPATLSPELLNGLLREKLGFNGMIVTDATPMAGFTAAMSRELSVPTAIASGCDMFLFNKDLAEDYDFMMKGYKNGIITEKRLEEALTRILATKVALKLHEKQKDGSLYPGEEELNVIGCEEHKTWAYNCADKAITLVKDTQTLLPISVEKHKRVLLQILGDFPSIKRVNEKIKALLTSEGFEITEYVKEDFGMPLDNVTDIKSKYDLVLYIGNIENASNKTVSRINWHTFFGLGNNLPWFVEEVPTMFVSVGNPYHLLDAPMVKTFINCYSNNDFVLEKVVEKILGRSEFKGVSPIDPFCGREDTRY
ncbi:glycosyl hydrolase [Clostridium folliculivorans]|uniref:beta-N-acetylhexosaminidase n=1 Tax=Clostridium folliculivorans TaxID=2886038 RepID=A0A9W6D9B4_9CLOT|nr:glycoside hydrolase family 3 N-terminal domain-containing protein [Clostridium folliculivorans]GKU24135.1 glycosyl hydrolase [Clostridium folliculivorans]